MSPADTQPCRRVPALTRVDMALASLLVIPGIVVGWALRLVALDDPYVTYRYAENIAAGLGPVYNPGERFLSTTALGYAYVLAALHLLIPEVALPVVSNALAAAGLLTLAIALFLLCARHEQRTAGLGAAFLSLLSPLLLSTFGLETCVFLGLVALSALATDARRYAMAAILGAGATTIRADAAIAFAVFWLAASIARRRPLVVPALIYVAIVAPYEAALAAYYGSPVPTTLAAKVAQATIGGWPDYAEGLVDLARDRLAISRWYATAIPLGAIGLVSLTRNRWAIPLVAWSALQGATYQALGVASYTWYYAPLLPGGILLVALGASAMSSLAVRVATPLGQPRLVAIVATLLLLAPLARAELRGALALRDGVPEPRALAYERAGLWLDSEVPAGQRVAVMEVGIMGYYARRPMIDLLGLIRPETIEALRRQDFFWTIADSQAETVVLTGKNPFWFQFAQPDHWFYQFYAPVTQIDQPGFWGTPVTIYQRQAPPRQEPALDVTGPGRVGEAIRLERVVLEKTRARPGEYLTVQLFWRAMAPIERDYAAFVHVLSGEPRVIVQHDTPVLATRWPVGELVQYYHPMLLPKDMPPGRYLVEVGLYHPEEPLRRVPPLDASGERNAAVIAELIIEAP